MSIEDQPGYPGLTSKGVLALHADWPAYPVDHGWTTAVFYLCSFPAETTFTVVDDIDRCLLLRAEYPTKHPKGRRIEEASPPGWHTAALPWPRWGFSHFARHTAQNAGRPTCQNGANSRSYRRLCVMRRAFAAARNDRSGGPAEEFRVLRRSHLVAPPSIPQRSAGKSGPGAPSMTEVPSLGHPAPVWGPPTDVSGGVKREREVRGVPQRSTCCSR